jgi:hypothetical protein
VDRLTLADSGDTTASRVEVPPGSLDNGGSAEEIIKAAREALDVLTSIEVISPPSLPVVRRLSTVPGRHGLVDFEESMIIWEVREVECSHRSAAWF